MLPKSEVWKSHTEPHTMQNITKETRRLGGLGWFLGGGVSATSQNKSSIDCLVSRTNHSILPGRADGLWTRSS